jgi:putative membrane protein
MNRDYESNLWKGLAAGVACGLVASWTMNQFQALWSRVAEGIERPHGAQSLQQGSPPQTPTRNDEEQDDATERVASAISENLLDRELTKSEKEKAGAAVHYAFGASTGAVYGAMAELAPGVTACSGLMFGAAVWVVADEAVVPALGLSKPPTEYPLSVHAYALSAHLVYGLTAEATRRAVRRFI